MGITLQALTLSVEQLEEWERVASARIMMQRAKERLSQHEADAQITKVQKTVSDRIGQLIQQAVR